jgi:glycosyltransferase involved in cell wall biosynthesis
MKIGYFLGNASINGGGTGPYAWRILENLLIKSKLQEIDLIILCSDEIKADCLNLIDKHQSSAKLSSIPQKFNILNRLVSRCADLISKGCTRFNIPSQGLKHCNYWFRWFSSLDIDLLHVPYQTSIYYNLPYPVVVTMHDVQELHYPEFFTPQERAWRAKYFWQALDKSTAVIVSFNHIKQDLIKYFRLEDSKIHICPLPYQSIYLQQPTAQQELQIKNKYDRWHKFLLYPAQSWEHKNHLSLIKALEYIKAQFGVSINLVCTGKKNLNFFPILEDYLQQSTVADKVHFMDVVPESELYWLYRNCEMVVVPTLYEAGSFPLLEAMCLEIPVICSDVTSLPDMIGDSRFIFNPLDIEKMSILILKMLDDSEFRADNILNSKTRIEQLKQVSSANFMIESYEKIINYDRNN